MQLLADFSERRDLPSGPVWPAYGQPGLWVAGPTEVRLAVRDGVPGLSLALRRSARPDEGPPPYGILDITLEAHRDSAEAQAELAAELPGLRVAVATADRVALSLSDGGAAVTGRPGRVIQQLEWDAANLLAETLELGEAPLILRGAAALRGVSARVACAAHAEAGFAAALRAAWGGRPLSRDALAFELVGMGLTEAVETVPPVPASDVSRLAEAMADRIVAHWSEVVGQSESSVPLYRLAELPTEQTWDLSQPFETVRWMALDDARLEALHAFIAANGTGGLISQRALPILPKGRQQVSILANLPLDAPGLHFAQVSLVAPPHPPARPAPATGTAVFGPDLTEAQVELRLSLGEPLAYTAEALAVVGDGAAMRQLSGGAVHQNSPLLVLGPEAFGVRVLQLRVDAGLAAEAAVTVGLRYGHATTAVAQDFVITGASQTLLLPIMAEPDAHLIVEAKAHDRDQVAIAEAVPVDTGLLSQSLFPAFGVHDVAVRMDPAPSGVVAIEVGRADDQIETFSFTADTPERNLRHFAASVFDAGLSWRWMGTATWDHHAPALGPLVLDPQSTA